MKKNEPIQFLKVPGLPLNTTTAKSFCPPCWTLIGATPATGSRKSTNVSSDVIGFNPVTKTLSISHKLGSSGSYL